LYKDVMSDLKSYHFLYQKPKNPSFVLSQTDTHSGKQ
jgi:hypothetical protein